jgi:Ala-tRNA(Pro) deacylase
VFPLRIWVRLLSIGIGHHFLIAVVPFDCFVDIEPLMDVLGRADVRVATNEELVKLCPDCELGALPPLQDLVGVSVWVDEQFASNEFIAFNAGTHQDIIRMRFGDSLRLAKPLVAHIAV